MKKILIFDFDGTIADTYTMVLESYRHLAPVYGWKSLTDEALERIRGEKPKDLMRKFGISKIQLPFLVIGVRAYLKRHSAEMKPCAGIPEALQALAAQGVTLGILTSNSKENVETFLRTFGLEKYFLFVVSSRHLFGKHRALKKLMQQNSVDPADVAYIGDEIRDVEAAKAAGVTSVAVTWGFQNQTALTEMSPDYLFTNPAELITITTAVS